MKFGVRFVSNKNTAVFDIEAECEPGTLLRVLEYFAVNSSTPTSVWARCNEDQLQTISIEVEGLSDQRAKIIVSKLGEIFTVNSATLSYKALGDLRVNPLKCA